MHMDIFNDDAFHAVTMTQALEDFPFRPGLIGAMNLFTDVPTATDKVSVERRGNALSIIQTSERGAPLAEGKRDRRNVRVFEATRIAKGHTMQASEIQGVRAFGTESELETMIGYVGRYEQRLIGDVELTWENMMLGAVTGVVLDADGTVLWDWYDEWRITKPDVIDAKLDDTGTWSIEADVCRPILRRMMNAAQGHWLPTTKVVGLCGDSFFDKLTKNKGIRELYLNQNQAQNLARSFGIAQASGFQAGSYATFDHGGILFINYRGSQDFDSAAKKAGTAVGTKMIGIPSTRCRFFPVGAPGVFQQAFAPGESFEFVNTIGRKLYALMVRDKDRNHWVRPEVYSYPLYMCALPELLLEAKENAAG